VTTPYSGQRSAVRGIDDIPVRGNNRDSTATGDGLGQHLVPQAKAEARFQVARLARETRDQLGGIGPRADGSGGGVAAFGGLSGARVNSHDVATLAAFGKEGANGMGEVIDAKAQVVDPAIVALKVVEAGQQLRLPTDRPGAGGADEACRAGAHAFNRLGAIAGFFYIYTWGQIFGHSHSSFKAF
jgi:hypothetical protein